MRKIWSLLKNHWLQDFSLPYYLSIVLFLAISLFINYYIGLENQIIDRPPYKPIRILWYLLLYGTAYYSACFLMIYFKKRKDILRSKQFWILTATGILLFSINSGFPFMPYVLEQIDVDIEIYRWLYSIGSNTVGFMIITIPLVCIYYSTQSKGNLYGLYATNFDFKPYFSILFVITPFIICASFLPGFQNYYPTYKANLVSEMFLWPDWMPILIYEFAYGIDFFNVEFIFRGFMVIGLAHLLGKDSIMPMVAMYCFIHFGKPVGEAISSIVGGYILGVIAYYTRSVWGGVIVHIGLAWMMELFAFLQKTY